VIIVTAVQAYNSQLALRLLSTALIDHNGHSCVSFMDCVAGMDVGGGTFVHAAARVEKVRVVVYGLCRLAGDDDCPQTFRRCLVRPLRPLCFRPWCFGNWVCRSAWVLRPTPPRSACVHNTDCSFWFRYACAHVQCWCAVAWCGGDNGTVTCC